MEQPPKSAGARFIGLLLIVVALGLVSLLFAFFLGEGGKVKPRFHRGGLEPGNPMPEIHTDGWLNGSPPVPGSLKGKVLVVDAWAWWCGPCLQEAPHLVAAYNSFRDRGVVFIGLAAESREDLAKMEDFVKKGKITWPCGYGARGTLIALDVKYIPQIWVVGPDGTILWNTDVGGTLESAIEEALAATKKVAQTDHKGESRP